jgi:hypothetical protein
VHGASIGGGGGARAGEAEADELFAEIHRQAMATVSAFLAWTRSPPFLRHGVHTIVSQSRSSISIVNHCAHGIASQVLLDVTGRIGTRQRDAGAVAPTPCTDSRAAQVRRPLGPCWRPFWLRFTYVTSVLVTKY